MLGEDRARAPKRIRSRIADWQPPAAFNVVATLVVLAGALALTWLAWDYYEYAPWTRDGRVRVYTVQVAPEVSGTVIALSVGDNQFVHKGDVLFRIDPRTYENTVKQAGGRLGQATAQAAYLTDQAKRRAALSELAVSKEQQENAAGTAQAASGASVAAEGDLDQAKLNLERTTVRANVDGWVTNLLLQEGSFATSGQTALTLVDAASFWVQGYFEETQMRRIAVGDLVRVSLIAYPGADIVGHVSGIGRGIDISDASPGVQGLPSVNPVFTWVRLAQRVPVHVELDDVPCPVVLASGQTATVTVLDPATGGALVRAPDERRGGSRAGLGCEDAGTGREATAIEVVRRPKPARDAPRPR